MRIGQILIEADLITPKQLSNGLEYGKAKGIAIGRVLKLLKIMTEADIGRTLEAQKLIRLGLSPAIAVESLKKSIKDQIPFENAIHERHKAQLKNLTNEINYKPSNLDIDYALPPEKLLEKGDKALLEDNCSLAEQNYLAAKSIIERNTGKNSIELFTVLNRLGNTCMALDRFDEAEGYYEEVLVLCIRNFPAEHVEIAKAYENLADLYKAKNDDFQALENFVLALNILEKKLPSTLSLYACILRKAAASTQSISKKEIRPLPLGELLVEAQLIDNTKLQDSLRLSKQLHEPLGTILQKNKIVSSRDLQSALKSQMYVRQGILTEQLAIDLLSRASRRNISLERLLHEASVLATDETKFDLYREITVELDKLVSLEASADSDQDEIVLLIYKIAQLYEEVGDNLQSEVYYSRALKIWEKSSQIDLKTTKAYSSLSKILISQERNQEALAMLYKSLDFKQKALGSKHEDTLTCLEDIVEIEMSLQNFENAISMIRSVISTREELGESGAKLLRIISAYAECLEHINNVTEAESAYNRAISMALSGFGPQSLALAAVIEKFADFYSNQKQFKNAAAQYEYALLIIENSENYDKNTSDRIKSKMEKIKTHNS